MSLLRYTLRLKGFWIPTSDETGFDFFYNPLFTRSQLAYRTRCDLLGGTSYSTTLPIRSPLVNCPRPFRFLDLPDEIRNKICDNVLCSVEPRPKEGYESPIANKLRLFKEEPPAYVTYLRHRIEPQILRTCRPIYKEGIYIMRKTSILPYMPIVHDEEPCQRFQTPCHGSWDRYSRSGNPRSFIILHRDLGRFCNALAEYKIFKASTEPF